jgi:hypothetical protein
MSQNCPPAQSVPNHPEPFPRSSMRRNSVDATFSHAFSPFTGKMVRA